MEVVAVNSAMYSVVLSLVVCMCAVAIFTGHILMLAIITITIIGKWTTFSPLVIGLYTSVVQWVCVALVVVTPVVAVLGSGDGSVVWSVGLVIERFGFKSWQERWENFHLQGQLPVLTLILVSIPAHCYCSTT